MKERLKKPNKKQAKRTKELEEPTDLDIDTELWEQFIEINDIKQANIVDAVRKHIQKQTKEIIILKGLIAGSVKSMSWMTTDMKLRFDEQRSNFGQEVTGGYSEELTVAIELLEELKKIGE